MTYPTISYSRNLLADDVIVGVETSGDLLNWRTGAAEVAPVSEIYLGDGRSQVTWRSTRPAGEASAQEFMRLRVEQR